MRLFINPPSLTSTDVIPLVNEAWKASFARVDKNKKAITECGWRPCNRNLLLYKEIQNTMTSDNCGAFKLLKRHFIILKQHNSFQPPVDSVSFQQSHSTTSISEISDPVISDNVFNNHTLLSLNYSAGNSAMVLETLIGAQDLLEARDRNRKNKEKGEQVSAILTREPKPSLPCSTLMNMDVRLERQLCKRNGSSSKYKMKRSWLLGRKRKLHI